MVKKYLIFLSFFIVFISFLVSLILFIPGPLKHDTLVNTYKGSTAASIANDLYFQGVIRNKYIFSLAMRLSGLDKRIVVGEFYIKKHVSIAGVINILIDSKKLYFRKIVIPEGYTVKQVFDVLISNQFLIGNLPSGIPEGYLMPNTYYFYKGESRASIIYRMRKDMLEYLNALWKKRDPSLPFNSKDDAVILASIVEKETSLASERALIAGVFLNRLKLNMRLQSDPTVSYGLNMRDAKGLTRKHLQTHTPYNTYMKKGLPVAPIANPGKASLYAVFYPAETDYLYFVADGNGGHKFSKTLEEHNRNVVNWRKIQNIKVFK